VPCRPAELVSSIFGVLGVGYPMVSLVTKCVEFLNSRFLLFHFMFTGVVKFETDLIHEELTSRM
jgi:hypothetical protein